jgi:hypothetical protein
MLIKFFAIPDVKFKFFGDMTAYSLVGRVSAAVMMDA